MPTGLVHVPFYYFPIVGDWNSVMSGHIHTSVGPAHYTSGAPICSEIIYIYFVIYSLIYNLVPITTDMVSGRHLEFKKIATMKITKLP